MSYQTPRLDYFIGRPVEEIQVHEGAEGQDVPVWSIMLEGEAAIHNTDPDRPPPPEDVVGLSVARIEYGAGTTTVHLGTDDAPMHAAVVLTSQRYAIAQEGYAEALFPERQQQTAQDTLPSDPSAERTNDGPIEPLPAASAHADPGDEQPQATEESSRGAENSDEE